MDTGTRRRRARVAAVVAGLFLFECIAVGAYFRVKAARAVEAMRTGFAVSEVWASDRAVLGTGAVRVVEFGDYECPPCRDASEELQEWLGAEPGRFALQFRNKPLTMHASAEAAARVAESVRRDRFWDLHNELYKEQAVIGEDLLAVMGAKYEATNASGAAGKVKADAAAAERLAISATPTFFVVDRAGVVYRCRSVEEVRLVVGAG